MKEALRAVGYGRVSTEEQEKSGTSLRDQFAGNHSKAKDIDAAMIAYFEDTDSGGFYLTRQGLQKALQTLEEGKANCLIVKDLVRLTRNDRAEQALILKRIKDAKATLIFWDVMYEDSPLGEFSLNVTGDFAILERAVIKDRTMKGRRRCAVEGVMPARTVAPFGYKIPTRNDVIRGMYPPETLGKYLIDPERAPIAAEIFHRSLAGESLHGICKWLQSAGVATVGGGLFWRPSNINTILDNPAYYGKAVFGRRRMITDESRVFQGFKCRSYEVPVPEAEWIRIDCPAIVSKEVWESCKRNREENRARLSTRPTYRLILTGLLRCPKCKRVMTGRAWSKNSVSHYKCKEASPSTNSIGKACWNKHINVKRVEPVILDTVKAVIRHPAAIEVAYQTYYDSLNNQFKEQEYQALKRELTDLNREEIATAKAQVQGVAVGANTAVYETLLREIALKRTRLEGQLAAYDKVKGEPQSAKDRASLIQQMLEDVELVLDVSNTTITANQKNHVLSKIIDCIYPSLTAEQFTITFRAFGDNTQLVAIAESGKPPALSVVSAPIFDKVSADWQ
ncbi:MAG: recombinase family protein [Abitibacteriaceae bacterium]|nr:recombinase family protein [Abditibacteriaceae bacterium]